MSTVRRRIAALVGTAAIGAAAATVALVALQPGVGEGAPIVTQIQDPVPGAVPVGDVSPAVSDDGTFAAFVAFGAQGVPTPFIRDVKGQRSAAVTLPGGTRALATSISGDGCTVAFWGSAIAAAPSVAPVPPAATPVPVTLYVTNRCTPTPPAAVVTVPLAASVTRPALSRDGSVVAYGVQPAAAGGWHVGVIPSAPGGSESAVQGAPLAVTTVDLSADGSKLAYDFSATGATQPSSIYVGPPGQPPSATVQLASAAVMAMPSLTADGASVAFVAGTPGSTIPYVASPVTGVPAPIGTASAAQPAITPDGSQVALSVAQAGGSSIVVVRATSAGFATFESETVSVSPVPATSVSPTISATGQVTLFAAGDGQTASAWIAQRSPLPSLNVSPSGTIDLGTVAIGSSSQPAKVSFSNPSTVGVTIGAVPALAAPFTTVADACSNSIVPPGGSCVITVAFKPTATGASNASLVVSGDGASATATIAGTGRALARTISIAPSTLQFPSTTVGARGGPVSATVTNSGEVAVSITDVALGGSDGDQFVVTGNACGGVTLDVGATCGIEITAIPSAAGSLRGSLNVTGSEGATASAILAVSAVSAPTTTRRTTTQTTTTRATTTTLAVPGRLQADPNFVTFEPTAVGSTSEPAQVTITNVGGSTVSSLDVQLLGDGEFAIAADSCSGSSLAVLRSCTLSVTVTPSAGGSVSGTLTVTGGRSESTSVALTATAAFAPTLRVNPGVVNAGGSTIVVGTGFAPSDTVNVELVAPNGTGTPVPLASTATDADGAFQLFINVPRSIGQGGWRLQVPAGTESAAAQVPLLIQHAVASPHVVGGGSALGLDQG